MFCSVIVSLGLLLSATSVVGTDEAYYSYIALQRNRHIHHAVPLQMKMSKLLSV